MAKSSHARAPSREGSNAETHSTLCSRWCAALLHVGGGRSHHVARILHGRDTALLQLQMYFCMPKPDVSLLHRVPPIEWQDLVVEICGAQILF